MKISLAVLNDVHLLPEYKQIISELVGSSVIFPNDSQDDEQALIDRTGESNAILISPSTKITATYIDACPQLKYIGLCGTTTANVDLEAVSKRGITIRNVKDYGDEPTAEFIFMQLVYLARGMGKYQWKDQPRELMGKSITVIGMGALGQSIANLALAYKMDVSYHSRTRHYKLEEMGISYGELDDLLPKSHIVIISAPTNTRVLDERDFEKMGSGKILVQASVGDMFDKQAFLKWIADSDNYAIFDYAAGANNYQDYSQLPHVIFPKVIAGFSYETRVRLGQKVTDNLRNYIESTLE